MKCVALQPFGLRVEYAEGTRFGALDMVQLRAWLDEHRVVQLRGLCAEPPHLLASACRRLGPLQPWPFGAVHEIVQKADAENYLYTDHAVPLHWDGAFADAVPHWLVFECVRAPPDRAGGETVFVDTTRVLANATSEQRARWQGTRVRYTTEKKAHYGGSFDSPVIARHPTLATDVIRYAEPVNDLNPVEVEPLELSPTQRSVLQTELSTALAAPEVSLALRWDAGDYVIADNHALLHGRRPFLDGAPRHLLRVNVLDPDRRWWTGLRAAWRVRRPEFFRAELPILLIPALVAAPSVASLMSVALLEAIVLVLLLFNVGDMVNCWFDRDIDVHRKTHLAEAVERIGRRSLIAQIFASSLLAVLLALHLAYALHRSWLAPAGLVGALLGASYTAPPLRLKDRGWWQLAAYVGLLFVGPMVLVSAIFRPLPGLDVLAIALAFGVMQTGVLLVNTAEDLDEDERERIRTIAVVLRAQNTIRLALALLLTGGLGLAVAFAAQTTPRGWLALGPLLAVVFWNALWLVRLSATMTGRDEAGRRAAIRAQSRHVPLRVESAAWTALLGALALLLAKTL